MSDRPVNYEIEELSWYHGTASRHVAETVLMQNGEDGSYLLRPSMSRPGDLALSVRCKDSVRHHNVTVNDGKYTFGLASFDCLQEFLDHFDKMPVVAGESGQMVMLKNPYPRDIQEPGIYERVRIHGQYSRVANSAARPHLAVASKEGFMTKQGGFVKNWKRRYFVLWRYELRYFRRESDGSPVRTLDLRQCTECCPDYSKGQPNCFRLVFQWRTFYFSCDSEAEMKAWMTLIHWKLEDLKKCVERT